MATISNKTRRPLRVPLPGGRTLHLGPAKTGQISSQDAEHGLVKKLVEESAIEIVDDDGQQSPRGVGGQRAMSSRSHARGSVSRRSGDR